MITKIEHKKIGDIKLPIKEIPPLIVRSEPYKEFLLYILELIKLNLNHHNQKDWRCGSSFCYAGFTDMIVAYSLDKEFKLGNSYSNQCDYSLINYDEYTSVSQVAQKYLGLNHGQAESLFIDCLTLEDVENCIENILNQTDK